MAARFGPASVDTPREGIHIELRAGGRYVLTMVRRDVSAEHAPGYDVPEMVEPELIVLRSDPMPDAGKDEGTSCASSSTTTAPRRA